MADETKLDTVNIGEVEIFETGEWLANKYDEKDLDEMVNNFKNKVAEPYITIDHSDKASNQFKDALRALSLGFVEKLERRGNKLIAWFKQVPKTIADLIEVGALKKKSIEFHKLFVADGKLYKNVLQGVTFHGANGLPEVNTLSDFLNLYKKDLIVMQLSDQEVVSLKNEDLKKEEKMTEVENLKAENISKDQTIKKLQADNEEIKEDIKEAETKTEEVEKENEEVKKENDELKETAEETEKEKEEELKKEADSYITDKIQNGFIRPKHKERYVNDYIRYKKDKEESFVEFKDDIETRTQIMDLGEIEEGENVPTNYKKKEFIPGTDDMNEDVEKTIQAYMKKNNVAWDDAAIKLGVIEAVEVGKKEQGE